MGGCVLCVGDPVAGVGALSGRLGDLVVLAGALVLGSDSLVFAEDREATMAAREAALEAGVPGILDVSACGHGGAGTLVGRLVLSDFYPPVVAASLREAVLG